jgi:DNA-directed RNA polymerase specialized sigma24 family protein
MNMPVPDLKAHLEKITDVVLKDLSKADIDSDFVREIKNNLSQSEGRTIPGTHFNETLVDLSSPDHAAIYQKAWEILKEKPLDLYIFLAGCLYIDAHRKTMPALGAEMGFSQQAAHKRLKSAKEALKSALPQLAHSPIFEKTAQIQRATRSQKFYAEAIPTVDEDKIDLSTEEHRIVFNAAKLLNPAQCYYLCMHALARDEHRQTYKEIAACVSVSEESVREAVARARDSIRSLLPEHYKDTRLIFQGPETSGRRSGVTALNIPRINKDLIDYSPDDVPAVLETATRFLTDYQLFIFVNHRMLVEKERMTTREIATAILNENPSVNADLNTVTHRVVASLSEINRKMQKFLPQDLKDTPILRQTPTHDRQSNSKIKCKVPELNRRFLELTTHEHRVLLPQIEKNLNPLQFYILASHRLLREHQRMTLPEIAEKCGRTVEDVRKILWDADKRLAKHLPEDLRNSPILRQKLVNPHKTQPDHMHPS